jgi:mothers against decapentaplegic homolog 1
MLPLLSRLNLWKKCDEDEEFVEKAVDSLFKKLKSKSGAIEDLERAISSQQASSKCVTIPRSLDGRLQVSHRKGLPHVIYCRIFRWPDLQTHHELRPIDSCAYPFTSKQHSEVCINPYHYERVDIPILPPVLVPKHAEFALGHSLVHNHHYTNVGVNNTFDKFTGFSSMNNAKIGEFYQQMNSSISKTNSTDQFAYNDLTEMSMLQSNSSNQLMNNRAVSQSYQQFAAFTPSNIIGTANQPNAPNTSMTSASSTSPSSNSGASPPIACIQEDLSSSTSRSPCSFSFENNQYQSKSNYTSSISITESYNWCSIVYYELNLRIGEIFNSSCNEIFVDGYTSPCGHIGRRLCLGAFSNINRNSTIENCRKHIGRGILYTKFF